MAKLTLADVTNLQTTSSVATLNSNSDATEEAIEKTLSRDGTSPNEMNADLDMNSHRIYNLPEPLTSTEPLRKGDFDTAVLEVVDDTPFSSFWNARTDTAPSQNAVYDEILEIEESLANIPFEASYSGFGGMLYTREDFQLYAQTYTPTLTNTLNVAASSVSAPFNFSRNGENIILTGVISIDVTAAATLTRLDLSLPVPSDFTSAGNAGGCAILLDKGPAAAVYANTVDNRLQLSYTSGADATAQLMSIIANYRILA